MVDPASLARLRPGMMAAALSDLLGPDWVPPGDRDRGRVTVPGVPEFGARIDRDGRIGQVSFYRAFPPGHRIEGLHIGIPLAAVRLTHPEIEPDPDGRSEGIEGYKASAPGGNELRTRFKDGGLIGFDLLRPGASYPEPPPPKPSSHSTAMAYDIAILRHPADPADPGQGWCFGLPPGILPAA